MVSSRRGPTREREASRSIVSAADGCVQPKVRRGPHCYGSMLETKPRSATRLQALRQPVTEHAEGDSNDDDGEPWEGRHPPRLADEIARLLNHGAPLRGGRLHT